jgi:hypothetical protein
MSGFAIIGLDIGSSTTKVCFRISDVGNSMEDARQVVSVAHWPVAPTVDQCVTERPTCLWTDGSAIAFTCQKGWHPVSDMKARLMSGWDRGIDPVHIHGPVRLSLRVLMALHVHRVLCDVKVAIERYVRYRGLRYPETIFVNCAIPSEQILTDDPELALATPRCPRRRGLAQIVEFARRRVFDQGVRMHDVVSLSYTERLAADFEREAPAQDAAHTCTVCIPEAIASILAAIDHPSFLPRSKPWDMRNPRREEAVPTVLVMDCGSLTTEFALFSYRGQGEVEFFAAGSCMAGAGLLAGDQDTGVAGYKRSAITFYRDFWNLIFTRTLGPGNPNVILPGPNTPQWRSLFIGGGTRVDAIADVLRQLCVWSSVRNAYRVAPMVPAQEMRLPDQAISYLVILRDNDRAPDVLNLQLGVQPSRELERAKRWLHGREYLHQVAIGLAKHVLEMPSWSHEHIPEIRPPIEGDRPPDWAHPNHHG